MLSILYNLCHQLILYEKQTRFRGLTNIIINIIITINLALHTRTIRFKGFLG